MRLERVSKIWKKERRNWGRIKTIQTTALLKSEYFEESWGSEKTRETGDQRKNQDNPDHTTVKIRIL